MLGLMEGTLGTRRLGSTMGLWLLLSGQAWAQTLPDGPLSAPNAIPPAEADAAKPALAKSASVKSASAKSRKAKKAHATTATDPVADTAPNSHPGKPDVAKPIKDTPADPLSLGLKWNGSNDNAEQTRTQNYSGSAPGTGASVGLKYHF